MSLSGRMKLCFAGRNGAHCLQGMGSKLHTTGMNPSTEKYLLMHRFGTVVLLTLLNTLICIFSLKNTANVTNLMSVWCGCVVLVNFAKIDQLNCGTLNIFDCCTVGLVYAASSGFWHFCGMPRGAILTNCISAFYSIVSQCVLCDVR